MYMAFLSISLSLSLMNWGHVRFQMFLFRKISLSTLLIFCYKAYSRRMVCSRFAAAIAAAASSLFDTVLSSEISPQPILRC